MEKQKEVYGIIYIIRNKVNNKLYIGQTTNKKGFNGRYRESGEGIEKVYNHYKWKKDHDKSYNVHLLNSIEKYGFNAFEVDEKFDIAYSKEELNKLEYMYIEIYECRNINKGYNNRYGGDNGKLSEEQKHKLSELLSGENSPWYGKHHTEESKKKMSEKLKERWEDEEYKQYMSEKLKEKWKDEEFKQRMSKITKERWKDKEFRQSMTGENHPLYGVPCSEERKRKIGEGNKGKTRTEEQKRKLSELFSGENHPWYGKHHTEETKKKMSKSHKNKQMGKDNPRATAIFCYELNDIRLTIKEWAEELSIDRAVISKCCSGKYKSAKGYHFRYATEEEIKKYKLKHGID